VVEKRSALGPGWRRSDGDKDKSSAGTLGVQGRPLARFGRNETLANESGPNNPLCWHQWQQMGHHDGSVTSKEVTMEERKILADLDRYFRLPIYNWAPPGEPARGGAPLEQSQSQSEPSQPASEEGPHQQKEQLPAPENVTVLIHSWYPPILNLSWSLNELDLRLVNKLDFYHNFTNLEHQNSEPETNGMGAASSSKIGLRDGQTLASDHLAAGSSHQLDPNLALWRASSEAPSGGHNLHEMDTGQVGGHLDAEERQLLERLEQRRLLLKKALTCFQITYNIINSR